MIKYTLMRSADQHIISQIAKLHCDSLSYRSFITLFGQNFLEAIYDILLKEQLGFLVIGLKGERIIGYIFACVDSSQIAAVMLKRLNIFIPIVSRVLIKKPYLIKNIIETLFYSSRENTGIDAELLVMAVKEEHRSKGVGTAMMIIMEDEFIKLGHKHYKVTVHREMCRSIKFYQANKMKFSKDFTLYGHRWNLYQKVL